MSNAWSNLHDSYKTRDWIDKPSLFAETAITYFPKQGRILDLGAGQGQDSRFFAEHGYDVVSTDLEDTALEQSAAKLPDELKSKVTLQKVDLRNELPFDTDSFDVVYAHLSLHYFDVATTRQIISEIQRVLKPGGVFAFFVNSVNDPEHGTGRQLEPDFFEIDQMTKRYFSLETTRDFTKYLDVVLLDDHGETYKDRDKGVHNLIRFIGINPPERPATMSLPFCGAIIERQHNGEREVLVQERWNVNADRIYAGTLEFTAGKLDHPFEDVHDAIAREIKEETGLTLKTIKHDQRTPAMSTGRDDQIIGFRPFCCVQQLQNAKPWVGFIFICEVEPGEPQAQVSESKNAQWMKVSELQKLYDKTPDKLFGLELPAWKYYFDELADK